FLEDLIKRGALRRDLESAERRIIDDLISRSPFKASASKQESAAHTVLETQVQRTRVDNATPPLGHPAPRRDLDRPPATAPTSVYFLAQNLKVLPEEVILA